MFGRMNVDHHSNVFLANTLKKVTVALSRLHAGNIFLIVGEKGSP